MSLFSDIAGAIGGEKAEDAQAEAARRSLKLQKEIYGDAKKNFDPYLGYSGSAGIVSRLFGLDGQPADLSAFTASPGYQMRLDQGEDAIKRMAAANGRLFSGATGKALVDYNQNSASQEFDNYLNRLFGISQMGQNAAGGIASLGQNYANASSNILNTMGQNQANAIQSQFGAWGSMADTAAAAAMGGMYGIPAVPGGANGAGAKAAVPAGTQGFMTSLFGM